LHKNPLSIIVRRLIDNLARLSDEVMTRLANRPITDLEFHQLFLRAARTAERRPPPDDSATQEQRRTRQRRNGPVPEEVLPTDDRGAHSRSITSDTPSRQLPTLSQDFVPADGSRVAQVTVAGSASSSTQQHQQTRIATGEGSTQLNGMGAERGQAASTRTVIRPSDPAATVVVNGSSLRERSTPNPLLSHLHHSSVPSTSTSPETYRASILSTMENPTQRPADAELSPFRPSRIRPW